MKVICIEDCNFYGQDTPSHLTKGNTYLVRESDSDGYYIVNNNGNLEWYKKTRFTTELIKLCEMKDLE